MGDRSSYSRQDTTSRSSREASNRSNRMDTYRRLSTARSETAGRGTSASGYDRAHSTHDVGQSSAGYQEGQNDGTAGQVGSSSGYNRAYNTYDAKKEMQARHEQEEENMRDTLKEYKKNYRSYREDIEDVNAFRNSIGLGSLRIKSADNFKNNQLDELTELFSKQREERETAGYKIDSDGNYIDK